MSTVSKPYLTRQQYLAQERAAQYKSEYLNGEIFAMSGASRQHNLIVTNLIASLHSQLSESDCEVYPSDMRVLVAPTGLYTYFDVVVACGDPKFEDEHVDTLMTPTVLLEVLSDSTKDYDRGGKWKHYRHLSSLKHYILVAQDTREIEHYARQADGSWNLTDHRPPTAVFIETIDCHLKWDEVYARVSFKD